MKEKKYTLVIPAYGEFALEARPASDIIKSENAPVLHDPDAVVEGLMEKSEAARLAAILAEFSKNATMENIYFYIREEEK